MVIQLSNNPSRAGGPIAEAFSLRSVTPPPYNDGFREEAHGAAALLRALQPPPSTTLLRRVSDRIAGPGNGDASHEIGLMSGPRLTMEQALGLKQKLQLTQ